MPVAERNDVGEFLECVIGRPLTDTERMTLLHAAITYSCNPLLIQAMALATVQISIRDREFGRGELTLTEIQYEGTADGTVKLAAVVAEVSHHRWSDTCTAQGRACRIELPLKHSFVCADEREDRLFISKFAPA